MTLSEWEIDFLRRESRELLSKAQDCDWRAVDYRRLAEIIDKITGDAQHQPDEDSGHRPRAFRASWIAKAARKQFTATAWEALEEEARAEAEAAGMDWV